MQKSTWILIGWLFFTANVAYVEASDTVSLSPSPAPKADRDVFGNLTGTDVQGNPNDKNAQGNRPKDVQGNVPKDIYGNKTGSENK